MLWIFLVENNFLYYANAALINLGKNVMISRSLFVTIDLHNVLMV